jgi:hypothetical protein
MAMQFEVGARVRVGIADTRHSVQRYVADELDPLEQRHNARAEPHVLLAPAGEHSSISELQNPAADGLVTTFAAGEYSIVYGRSRCTVPDPWNEDPARFVYDPSFPLARLFGAYVRPALHVALARREAAVVHASAVEIDGTGLLVGGWAESGKTETALAFAESGARFVSDKWTIVGLDRGVSVFPVSVGIRRWVLPYAPRLARALPLVARGQLAVAAGASFLTRPLRRRTPHSRIGALAASGLEQAVALGDRASLRPSQVRAVYGGPTSPTLTIGALAVLVTVPTSNVRADHVTAAWAARRLARAATFERRRYFDVYRRRRYVLDDEDGEVPDAVVERSEERLLSHVLADVPVLKVSAPFPTDPRRVADAIAHELDR